MSQYYLHNGHAQRGPFTLEELKSENIHPDSLVWFEGNKDWMKASDVEDLKSILQIIPSTIKTPPPLPDSGKSKKSKRVLISIAAGVLIVSFIIGYLLYQNAKHQEEIINVQSALVQKNKETAEQLEKDNQVKAASEALEGKQLRYRNNWASYVILYGSKYMTNGFGGISDLDLTIANNTEYPLDNVEVEVDYIKSNGGLYKTEKVTFDIIPAGITKTLRAPSSSRGTSVSIRIQKIRSTAFHFCYDRAFQLESGDHGISTSPNGISGNASDPWKCN
jgi:hypothetical protein